jgi:hypothetical protein
MSTLMFGEKDGWIVSWKKIAAYIGKTEKTAKRYHKLYGMPVRRDPGGTAIGLKPEINLWLIKFDELMRKYNGKAYEHLVKRFKKAEKSIVESSETFHNDT